MSLIELMNRRGFLKVTGLGTLALTGHPLHPLGADQHAFQFRPTENLIPAPDDPAEWPRFRRLLDQWRSAQRQRYPDDSRYRDPAFAWASRCFACGFVMLCDQRFYDATAGRYQVEDYLDQAERDFGGLDAVVLWHAYPRLGVDPRNQFDFYRDMPGGILGLRDVFRRLHDRDVRAFISYNPWDTGTRREPKPDLEVLALLVQALQADGIFLDTMDQGAGDFRARLDQARPGVALESELPLPLERVVDHHLSWAQGFGDTRVPGILRNKWFERRHMLHQINRWHHDRTADLQTAWMNGSGTLVWENVFGSWMGWSPRDRSLLRSMLPIQRRFAGLFSGDGWAPLVPTLNPSIYASRWEGDGIALWTVINRSDQSVEGPLLELASPPRAAVYDLTRGRQVEIVTVRGRPILHGELPPRGVAAWATAERSVLGTDFPAFLARQAEGWQATDWDPTVPLTKPKLRAAPATARLATPPDNMVAIPAATLDLSTTFRIRECGLYGSDPFEAQVPTRLHQQRTVRGSARLARYAIDLTPVTNRDFARFLDDSGYRPTRPDNFLKHWGHGHPPPGQEDHPVVYVDLLDARAFATWAGKRLPTAPEWQHAAEGPESLRYPWGDTFLPGRCNDGSTGQTTAVTAFPEGRSPYGLYDLCGNTWEWTESEYDDGRTRFCLLKGGSSYRPQGSEWYFDGGPQPNQFAAKFLLLWPGLDRCATVGFRCALDLS